MKIRLYTLTLLILLISISSFCQKTLNITVSATTINWSTALWSPAGPPGVNDDVIINYTRTASGAATATVNIDVPLSIKSLSLNGSWGSTGFFGSTGTKLLRVEALSNVSISGAVALSSTGGNDLTTNQSVEFVGRNVNITIGGTTTVGATTNTKYCYFGGSTGFSPTITFNNDVTFHSRSGTRSNGTYIFSKSGNQVFTNNCSSGLLQYVDFANMQVGNGTTATSLTMAGTATFSTDIMGGNLTVKSNATLAIPETWTLNQYNSPAGILSVESNGTLKLGDDVGGIDLFGNNFPAGFNMISLNTASTVEYNGSSALTQFIYEGITYGNLVITRGGTTGSSTKYVGNSSNFFAPTNGQLNIAGSLLINSNTNLNIRNTALFAGIYDYPLFVGNSWTNNGTFTPNSGIVTFNGSTNGTLGGTTATTFYNLTMNKSTSSARIAMSNNATVSYNLTLTNGIIATANNLLTWNNSGGTLLNLTPFNSFIATCDASGNALTATGLNTNTTSQFTGNVGFRIKNITKTMSSAMVFPVSADFVSPNRMNIRPANLPSNTGTTDITVVVGKGDIAFTPNARVNRVWYTHATNTLAVADCSVGLYFRKRIPSAFGISQDEVESGFNPLAVEVGRKDYTDLRHLTHRSPSVSIGTMDGITETTVYYNASSALPVLPGYYKFSVGNFGTIILPSLITNIKAAAENKKVNIQWTALNELNVDHYEIEHSTTANNFRTIAKATAINNGNSQHNYAAVHEQPLQGKNFYRIKSVDKDGTVQYTSIVSVIIGGNKVSIAVIPNPVQNKQLNLQLNNIPAGRYNLMLYNTTGQLVYTKYIDHPAGSSMQSIMLSNSINKGTYILKLVNENNKFTEKVIIE